MMFNSQMTCCVRLRWSACVFFFDLSVNLHFNHSANYALDAAQDEPWQGSPGLLQLAFRMNVMPM